MPLNIFLNLSLELTLLLVRCDSLQTSKFLHLTAKEIGESALKIQAIHKGRYYIISSLCKLRSLLTGIIITVYQSEDFPVVRSCGHCL